jgi:hypothetical protein
MYAGFVTHKHSSQWLGTHQRCNMVAHRLLLEHVRADKFPTIKAIQKFEGENGPDGIKVKSPSQNELWHYYDPLDDNDTELIDLLEKHINWLAEALKTRNVEKAAFEAAWLSHGIVDGLTPAHHYPYEEEMQRITRLGWEDRTSKASKIIAKGDNKTDWLRRNWQIWGTKGLLTTHQGFEMGVATIIFQRQFRKIHISDALIKEKLSTSFGDSFRQTARYVAKFHMYERFYRKGWNTALAKDVKEVLMPSIMTTVAEAWYRAVIKSQEKK